LLVGLGKRVVPFISRYLNPNPKELQGLRTEGKCQQ
jgi:hypothetical protein